MGTHYSQYFGKSLYSILFPPSMAIPAQISFLEATALLSPESRQSYQYRESVLVVVFSIESGSTYVKLWTYVLGRSVITKEWRIMRLILKEDP